MDKTKPSESGLRLDLLSRFEKICLLLSCSNNKRPASIRGLHESLKKAKLIKSLSTTQDCIDAVAEVFGTGKDSLLEKGTPLRLNDFGEKVLAAISKALSDLDNVARISKPEEVKLVIGTHATFETALVPHFGKILKRLNANKDGPTVSFAIEEIVSTTQGIGRLSFHTIDLLLEASPVGFSAPGINHDPLAPACDWVAMIPKSREFTKEEEMAYRRIAVMDVINPSDLAGLPICHTHDPQLVSEIGRTGRRCPLATVAGVTAFTSVNPDWIGIIHNWEKLFEGVPNAKRNKFHFKKIATRTPSLQFAIYFRGKEKNDVCEETVRILKDLCRTDKLLSPLLT